jgi:GntR family transcriptional regulator, transcriptional repressor for pyruvate dehydrogenase complex
MESSDHFEQVAKPRRRYIPIAQDLLRQMQTGTGPDMVKLPSDRELADQYGVSRATVREALFALDLIGAVEVKHGDGTYVASRGKRLQASDQFQYGALPEHVIETRIVLEPSISMKLAEKPDSVAEAARVHNASQNLIEDQTCVPEFTRQALQFHLSLAGALDNKLMGELAFEVICIDNQPLWALINQLDLQSLDHRRKVQQEHYKILEAIRSGDQKRAFQTMEQHLKNNKTRIVPPETGSRPRHDEEDANE